MFIRLPVDDGETAREVAIEFDNVSLELIDELRAVTSPIEVEIKLILASDPDFIQLSFSDLKLRNITYTKQRISAKLYMDSFLNIELTSEKYGPSQYPGLF